MSASASENGPWPARTLLPTPLSSSVRKRKRTGVGRQIRSSKFPRQSIADEPEIDQAKTTCQLDSDNSVVSCWPTASTVIAQHEWTQFVWNSRLPQFSQLNEIDIFLFRADSGDQIFHFSNQTNPFGRAGSVPLQVNDSWWGADGANWSGQNVSFPFYFVAIRSDKTLEDNTLPLQPTFSAVQTTFADSVLAAMSSTSVAAASASAAASRSSASASSVSSASSAAVITSATATLHGSGPNGLQNSSSNSTFPRWAIAVIVILGFFATLAFIALIFLIVRAVRRRRRSLPLRRGSMGSQSPMMANAQTGDAPSSASPQLGTSAFVTSGATAAAPGRAGSFVSPDGASAHSDGLFSGADAAVMAEAFRKALRKPDFADRPVEEGESPEAAAEPREEELINRELAQEGRGIRSVGTSRGVKVETLSDDGDTAQDSQY